MTPQGMQNKTPMGVEFTSSRAAGSLAARLRHWGDFGFATLDFGLDRAGLINQLLCNRKSKIENPKSRVSSPGVEPGLQPSHGCVRIPHTPRTTGNSAQARPSGRAASNESARLDSNQRSRRPKRRGIPNFPTRSNSVVPHLCGSTQKKASGGSRTRASAMPLASQRTLSPDAYHLPWDRRDSNPHRPR